MAQLGNFQSLNFVKASQPANNLVFSGTGILWYITKIIKWAVDDLKSPSGVVWLASDTPMWNFVDLRQFSRYSLVTRPGTSPGLPALLGKTFQGDEIINGYLLSPHQNGVSASRSGVAKRNGITAVLDGKHKIFTD